MKILNTNLDPQLSLALADFASAVEVSSPGAVSIEQVSASGKGEILSSVLISIGTNMAANAIYDLLKLAIARYRQHIQPETVLQIDEKSTTVREFIDKPGE